MVVDVLRATTTMTAALAAGAEGVVPCLEVETAREVAARMRAAGRPVLLGGERGGVRIEGFDLGNSPAECTPQRVAGRTLVFTTTNGTRALEACQAADRVLLAAFVNREAVVQALQSAAHVHVVCAGTQGRITREDTLLAGALVDALEEQSVGNDRAIGSDEARLAQGAWRDVVARCGGMPSPSALARELADSQGGRNVRALGLEADLQDAAALDRYRLVPELDRASGVIRAQVRPTVGR